MQVSELVQDTQIRHEASGAFKLLIEDELAGRLNAVVLDYAVNAFRMALDERRYVTLESIPYTTAVAGALSRLQIRLKACGVALMTELITGKRNKPKSYEVWLAQEKPERRECYERFQSPYKESGAEDMITRATHTNKTTTTKTIEQKAV